MKRVIVSGGGTGGHIYPAVAVAEALRRRFGEEVEILFVGAEGKMEMEKVPALGYRIVGLPIAGLQRRLDWRNLAVPFKAVKSIRMAKRIIRDFGADAVVGFGGYASAPVLWAAQRMGVPTVIQEQNSYAGVTNKLLAKDVDVVFAASAAAVEKLGAPEKTLVVGNPVRPEILNRDRAAARAAVHAGDRTVILSFGGSLGARRINEVVAELCAWEQANDLPVLHLHATGSRGVKLFEDLEAKNHFAPGANLVVKEYIDNMPDLLAAADLVISRSGALTLAELEAMGRASILIPSPNVAENHQYYNALELQNAGAAIVIEEKDLTGVKLIETVHALLAEPGKLTAMGTAAKTLGNPKSLELITAKLLELVNGK